MRGWTVRKDESKRREYKAKVLENNTLQIQCKAEVIKHEDGKQDVIIHAPALKIIQKFKDNLKDEK